MKLKHLVPLMALIGLPGGVLGGTLIIEPSRDNTLYEDPAGQFSNGAGQFLFIGRTGADNGIINLARRTVLAFDLSAIPPGSTIESVDISFNIGQVPPGAQPGTATLHRLTANWGEGASNAPGPEGRGAPSQPSDATWIHTFFDTGFWTTPGGDFVPTASASTGFSNSPEVITFASSPGLVSDVQQWVNNPAGNFGWILRGDESSNQNARQLFSRENASQAARPTLSVSFIPAAPIPNAIGVPATGWTANVILVLVLLMAGIWTRRSGV